MIRNLLFASALLLPFSAQADDSRDCRHSAPRQLDLDMEGVRTVTFDVGRHQLRLEASSGAGGALEGRACASNAGWLEKLQVGQRRDGDRLHVELRYDQPPRGIFLGRNYARLELAGSIPRDVAVELSVGSGDARVVGASALGVKLGSGDVDGRSISGPVAATVGSGDLTLSGIGSLDIRSIGSGDVEVERVEGDAVIGSIGSGDLEVRGVGGNASIRSIGSGDAELSGVRGDVTAGSIGSGDLQLRDVGGSVTLESLGSGDFEAHGVGGDFTVSSKGSGDIRHRDVAGEVDVPKRR